MDKRDKEIDRINELVINYLTNEINSDDLILFYQWINGDKKNREHFNNIRNTWILSEVKPDAEFNPDTSFAKLNKIIKAQAIPEKGNHKIRIFRWYHVAAAGFLLFILGSLMTTLTDRKSQISQSDRDSTEIFIPYGSKSKITLSDGSEVWINAGSSIKYSNSYNKENREIDLRGEAFFDVKTDRSRPFTVKTSRMIVKAAGTKFNLKSYPDENTESAILVEGTIDVEVINEGRKSESYRLKPNEKLVIHSEGALLTNMSETSPPQAVKVKPGPFKVDFTKEVRTELYTSWKDNRWVIEGEPLETLVPVLERRYNLKFRFADEEAKAYKFSGTIQNETIEQILEALTMTAPVKYHIKRDSVLLEIDLNSREQYTRLTNKNQEGGKK